MNNSDEDVSISYTLGLLVGYTILRPIIAVGKYWVSSHINELDSLQIARAKRLVNYSTCIVEIAVAGHNFLDGNNDAALWSIVTGEAIRGIFNFRINIDDSLDDIVEDEVVETKD